MKKLQGFILLFAFASLFACTTIVEDDRFISYTTQPGKIQMWKDGKAGLGSIAVLKDWVERKNEKLVFAMNGGMYKPNRQPLGLYIENGQTLSPVDTLQGTGNFYLQPNGIFYISNSGEASICPTPDFLNKDIKYATQSGPMLIIRGELHPAFRQGSSNLQVRNAVGILPNGNVMFAMSKKPISFYDLATFFKSNGCQNALYLDGYVSRTYLPEKKWIQTGGDFGVMIGVTEEN